MFRFFIQNVFAQKVLITFILFFLMSQISLAANFNPPYPRTSMLIWGGASPAWLAEFDWVITSWKRDAMIRDLKQVNPDVVVSGTADHNACERIAKPCPVEWGIPRIDNNSYISAYSETLGDTSDYSGRVNGQNYRDALVDFALQKDWTLWDGWNSDGLWADISWKSDWKVADVNRDGKHDGADDQSWQEGRIKLLQELRRALPPGKIITAWAGALTTYWGEGPKSTNGAGAEKFLVFSSWGSIFDKMLKYDNGRAPHFQHINGHNEADKSSASNRKTKENYRFMRFGLGTALMTGAYYSYEDASARQNEHFWVSYYDEYDVPLGYPLAPVYEIRNRVYARFYDGGAVILNANTSDKTVTENDLRQAASASGLDWNTISGGTYYRFQGQQDPSFNNGQKFDSITLKGESMGGYDKPKGDSIILVKNPQTVVAPIIIDTEQFATSPGVKTAKVSGFQGTCGKSNSVIGFRTGYPWCSSVNPLYGYTESSTNRGNTVTFEVGLVNGGSYKVYEYHPGIGSIDAFDVPHTIYHAGGQSTVNVDQRKNTEQWNLLGTYNFNANQVAKVVITDNAKNSKVSADAIKFAATFTSKPSSTPPPTPSGPAACHLLGSSQAVPSGFGASYNVLSSAREQIFKTTCSSNSVDISLGNGD